MKLKATSHKKTAGKQRMVGRLEREYASTAENKPAYKCSDCGTHVIPSKTQTVDRKLSVEEHLDHEDAGREVSHNKKTGITTIRHPPQMVKEGKLRKLEHGAVTADMVPRKDLKQGKQTKVPGKCPGCHTAATSTKEVGRGIGSTPESATSAAKVSEKYGGATTLGKSIDLFDDLLFVNVEKSVLKHGDSHALDWSHQFGGTPHHQDALQCLRDQLDVDREYAQHRKDEKPWSEIDKLPGPEREAYHKENDSKRKKIEDREHKAIDRKHELERKLIDHRIEEAKKMGKSAAAVAYEAEDHSKTGKTVKKSFKLILTV
jgi:hypothetical protein